MSVFFSELSSHIWQSTICAILAGALTLLLKKNGAQTRYWIWFLASVKFLIPFAWLTSLGSHIGWSIASVPISRYDWLLGTAMQPSSNAAPGIMAAARSSVSVSVFATYVLLGIWVIGMVAMFVSWYALWRRVDSTLRGATRVRDGQEFQTLLQLQRQTGIKTPIELAYSYSSLEPGVFGILRPVLLLPIGILKYLDSEHMEAVLLHELLHVRRRDNLMAFIHMLVQTLFWFHPLVWWLGARLVNERESACDEDVLCFGNKPQVYAESILRICKYCMSSPIPCVSGISGGELRKRIEKIVSCRVGRKLNFGRRALLAAAAFLAVTAPIVIGMIDAPGMRAQSDINIATRPKFDLATIKPSDPRTHLSVLFAPGGRLVITHATVRFLMKIAYDVGDDQIEGGPDWVHSRRFDVEAKPDVPIGGDPRNMTTDERRVFQEQVRLRLQSLLADRFQLKLRIQAKDLPVYALIVSKNGPKMQLSTSQSDQSGIKGGRGEVTATNAGMDALAHFLGEQSGRPIVDMTGLKGKYDFQLQWTPDAGQTLGVPDAASNSPASVDSIGTSLFTAVQEQLGLKLQSRKSAAEFLTVETATAPVAN